MDFRTIVTDTLWKQAWHYCLTHQFQYLTGLMRFSTAVYLIHRLPTPTLEMSSPYAQLFGTSPNYLKLRVFGSLCYP